MQLALDLTHLLPRTRRAVLVCDVVESVRLMQEDEDGTVRRWQQLVESMVREVIPAHSGRLVKSLGDGLMLEFGAPRQAVQAAFAIQQLAKQGYAGVPPAQHMHLRIGVHSADVVQDQMDIYGHGVNLTARIATLAGPGEIVVTAEVRDQLVPVLDGDIEDLGDCYLKHVKEPVRAYRVGEAGPAPIFAVGANRPLDLRPTVAVIPFAARGMEPGHALIGEAVADELIAAISKTAELHVISRLSTSAFKERAGDAQGPGMLENVRQHLGATYVLSGRCTVLGQQMHLFVELAEADGGRIVWADSLKGTVSGLFDPEDDMLSRVVSAVSSAVMRQELQRAQNHALPTLEGYTLLMASVAMMHRTDYHDFDKARQMLEHLIERSKRHPIPHAWLAKWHVLCVAQGWTTNPSEMAKKAQDATNRALDADPQCALALTVDGLVCSNLLKDMETASIRHEQALAANPNESLAWLFKGTMHSFRNEGSAATMATERAIRLSPLDPLKYFYDSLAATAALSAGDYERAIALATCSLRANRTHTSTLRALALAQALSGEKDAAKVTVSSLRSLEPEFSISSFLARYPGKNLDQLKAYTGAFRDAGLPEN
jgi:adenylate cyclase